MKGMKSCFLVLKTWRFTLCLLLCFSCLPQAANAVDYYWKLDLNGSVQPEIYSDGMAACASLNQRFAGNGRNYYGKVVSSSDVECWDQVGYTRFNGRRFGDSCPAGTQFDPVTTKCVLPPNPCADKPPMPFSKSGTASDGYMTIFGKNSAPATEGCFGGCLASTSDQKCTTKTSGSYFCRGTAYFSGQACSSGIPGVDQSDTAERPDPKNLNEEKPCIYKVNPDGTQSCNSSKSTEQEGQVCGTISATGEKICVDRPPNKNGVDVSTKVEQKNNSDGTFEVTKTDTATTTKCDGVKSCTSSSTTVTTTVKKDGDGKTQSTTGSCSGSNCPNKNTNPDADGDGFGDCVKGDCGEGEGGSEVQGEACDAQLLCSGDAVQCAILRKEKEQKCADEKFREVKEDKLKNELNEFFAKPEYQPLKPEGDNVFDMGAMFDTSRTISGSCPVIQDWHIEYGMDIVIPINQINEKICPYYVYMGYLIVMFAMWRSTEIVARGLN